MKIFKLIKSRTLKAWKVISNKDQTPTFENQPPKYPYPKLDYDPFTVENYDFTLTEGDYTKEKLAGILKRHVQSVSNDFKEFCKKYPCYIKLGKRPVPRSIVALFFQHIGYTVRYPESTIKKNQ